MNLSFERLSLRQFFADVADGKPLLELERSISKVEVRSLLHNVCLLGIREGSPAVHQHDPFLRWIDIVFEKIGSFDERDAVDEPGGVSQELIFLHQAIAEKDTRHHRENNNARHPSLGKHFLPFIDLLSDGSTE